GMAGELKIDADGLRLLQIKGLVIHQDKGLLAIDALHHILQRDPVRPPFGGGDRSGRSDRNHRRRKRSDPSKPGSLPLPEPSSTRPHHPGGPGRGSPAPRRFPEALRSSPEPPPAPAPLPVGAGHR